MARGLPLCIRDHFNLDPYFFCSSDSITEALNWDWDFSARKYLSSKKRIERDRLDEMDDKVNAEVKMLISKDQQRALTLDTNKVSVETCLTKGDTAPPATKSDELSDMDGSTTESKVKAANSAVKKVAAQYTSKISNMNEDMGAKDDKIEKLLIELNKLKSAQLPKSDSNLYDKEDP